VTRVIAGAARGRRLAVPPGRLTRPTSDRAREGLFGTLTAIHGPLEGARVLDLYAGSGAVGLEALSRGAARVLFIEADAGAARVIRDNLAVVGLPGGQIVTGRVERVLARGPGGGEHSAGEPGAGEHSAGEHSAGEHSAGEHSAGEHSAGEHSAGEHSGKPGYGLVVADPPYAAADEDVVAMLAALRDGSWLAPGAVVAVERATRSGPLPWPSGYEADRSRRYGEATFWYGLAAGNQAAQG
jgi:16S rRNA (guanine966-N2)-methyltransferase